MGNDSQKEPEVPDERHYLASGAGLAGHPKNRNFAGPDPESAGPLILLNIKIVCIIVIILILSKFPFNKYLKVQRCVQIFAAFYSKVIANDAKKILVTIKKVFPTLI